MTNPLLTTTPRVITLCQNEIVRVTAEPATPDRELTLYRLRGMLNACLYYGVRGEGILPDACETYLHARAPLMAEAEAMLDGERSPPTTFTENGALLLFAAAVKIAAAGSNGRHTLLAEGLQISQRVLTVLTMAGGEGLVRAVHRYGVGRGIERGN